MFSKCVLIILFMQSVLPYTYGQVEGHFFRKDYIYVEYLSSFYKINTVAKSWLEARNKCEMEGATLFYAEDDEEAEEVIKYWNITQPLMTEVFVGVAAWQVKDVLETVDGRQISDVYDNWAPGEPNTLGCQEGCVTMRRDGTMADNACGQAFPYICKKRLATLEWNKECNIPDYSYKYNSNLNRCYKFHLTPKNWSDAYITCSAEQSYLAIINSPEENQYLISLTAEAPKDNVQGAYLRGAVHLGFYNYNNYGWKTIKGVPLHQSGFYGWGYLQPDGGNAENCGSMFYSGQLNDIGCFQNMFFICEHEIQTRTQYVANKYGATTSKAAGNVFVFWIFFLPDSLIMLMFDKVACYLHSFFNSH